MSKTFFTIIELLVVISIITILSSLLLPSLQRARGQATAITCANRVKQLVAAAHMYTGDYDNFVVPNAALGSNDAILSGMTLIYPYITGCAVEDLVYENYVFKVKKFPAFFLCPANVTTGKRKSLKFFTTRYMHYATNRRCGTCYQGRIRDPYKLLKVSRIKGISRKLYISEKGDQNTGYFDVRSYQDKCTYYPTLQHGTNFQPPQDEPPMLLFKPSNLGKANVGFFDGHVSALGYQFLSEKNFTCFIPLED